MQDAFNRLRDFLSFAEREGNNIKESHLDAGFAIMDELKQYMNVKQIENLNKIKANIQR